MHLMRGLTMTVFLSNLLNDLFYKGISLAKDPLNEVVHPLEYFHSTILLYIYQYYMWYYNKTKCVYLSLVATRKCTRYSHSHFASAKKEDAWY